MKRHNDGWLSTLSRLAWPRRKAKGAPREEFPLRIEALEERTVFAISGGYTLVGSGGSGTASSAATVNITAVEGDQVDFSVAPDAAGLVGFDHYLLTPTDANSKLSTPVVVPVTQAATFNLKALSADLFGSGFGFVLKSQTSANVDIDVMTVNVTFTGVNDAPLLAAASPVLTGIAEDPSANVGDKVSTVVGSTITDVDFTPSTNAAKSIAVTSVDNTNGKWQYSIDSGANWVDFTATTGSVVDLDAASLSRLLTKDDLVRFAPGADYNGTATFTYRAWDESSGTAHGVVQIGTNVGLGNAFSTQQNSATVTVAAVNDAPVLAAASPSLTGTTEGTASSPGDKVSAIVGATISDVDVGSAPQSIVVTKVDNTGGLWQFSANGSSWSNFSSTSGSVDLAALNQSRLLSKDYRIRFNPSTNFFGSATFEYRAWDETSGTAGAVVTISATGGTTAFSSGVNTATLTVAGVNDAPVVPVGTTAMTAISEDPAPNDGQTVASIVGSLITDVDYVPSSDALQSIAVRQVDNTNGKWQYSIDGGSNWLNFTASTGVVTLNASSAIRLLSKDDLVRFVPNANYNGSSSFQYRAWDESDGLPHGSAVMLSAIGGTTPYSNDFRDVSLAVTAVNDSPVLAAAAPVLTSISEDPVTNGGDKVSTIVGATITDADDSTPPQSIAVTQVDNTNGLWQYSTNNGTSWLNFTTTTGVVDLAAAGQARLLTQNHLVRFAPSANYNGAATFQYRAWDETSGTAGSAVTISATGGATAFSAAANTGTVTVVAVNDAAPVLAAGTYNLTGINEDPSTNGGTTVGTLVGSGITDADYSPSSNALKSIVVTAVVNTGGKWQYSIDGGTNWLDFSASSGSVDLDASTKSVLLSASDLVRFAPTANFSGSANLSFRAWDESNGLAHGTNVKVGAATGGANAYSTTLATGSVTITAVADAPTLTVPASYSGTEGGAISITGISAALTDTDGSETISRYRIDASALTGAVFNKGTDQGGGIWTFTAAELTGLTLTAGDTNGAAVNLSVTARSKETSNSDFADSAAKTIAVTIANAAPVATISVNPGSSFAEGTSLTYKGTFTDAGGAGDDKYLVTWTAVGGAENTVFTEALSYGQTSSFTFAPADNASYTITMKVQDEYDAGTKTFKADSLNGSTSAGLTVTNAAPTTALVSQPSAGQLVEGNTLSFQVQGDDAGKADTLKYEYSWYFLGKDGLSAPVLAATSPTDLGVTPGTAKTVAFTPASDGKYELRFKVTDDDLASASATYSFTVANVGPAEDAGNTTVPAANAVTEGNVYQIDYAFTDPAFMAAGVVGAEAYSISVDWGDGSTAEVYTPTVVDGSAGVATKGTAALKHVYADGQATGYTVTITVSDGDGNSSSSVHTATIKNAAPTIVTKAGAQSVVEGGTLTFTAGSPLLTFSDPGFSEGSTSETFKVTIDWGDGNTSSNVPVATVVNGTRTSGTSTTPTTGYVAASHQYLDNQVGNAAYTVTVTLVDDDGGTSSFTLNVTVTDQAPTPTIDAHPASGPEATATTFTGSFSDPGGASDANYSYSWSVAVTGNPQTVPTVSGTAAAPGALAKSLTFTPTNAGVYTVTLTVTDADGVVGTQSFVYTVSNVPPTADVSAPTGTLDEGSPLSFDLTASSPSASDPIDYAYEIFYLGKTGLESHSVQTGTAAGKTSGDVVAIGFTPADDGKYRIVFTATDDDGAVGSDSTDFTVANVVPTVTGAVVPGANVVSEGQVFSIDYSFSDPGFTSPAATSSETFKITVDWGDGNTEVFTPTPANGSAGKDTTGSIKLSHAYADGKSGAYSVKVTLADDDGGSVSNTYSATIKNVAPTIGATAANQTVLEGQPLVFDSTTPLLTFTDPGFNENLLVESYAVTVDWGDGNVDTNVPVTTFVNGVRTDGTTTSPTSGYVGITHTYANNLAGNAPYTVTVTFTDDDGGTVSTSLQVTVQNVPPTVNVGGPTTGAEGAAAVFTGSFSDPGQGNDANYSYTWSVVSDNGQVVAAQSGSASGVGSVPSYGFTARDEGKYTVSLTVTDADGGSTTKTYDYTVSNVAPTATITSEPAGQTTNEGTGVVYKGAFTDPGVGFDDAYTFTWTATGSNGDSFTQTGTVNYGDALPDFAFTPTNDGSYTVTLQVSDDVGASKTASTTLTATNVAPTVTITSSPAGSTDEGSAVTYKAKFSDPAGSNDDFFVYTWTATSANGDSFTKTGVLNYGGAGTGVPDFTFTPTNDGAYTVTITVRDEADASGKVFSGDSQTGTQTSNLTVLNVGPTLGFALAPTTSPEGTLVTYQATFSDPAGSKDDFYGFQWTAVGSNGDSFQLSGSTTYGASMIFTFTPTNDGVYVVALKAWDEAQPGGSPVSADSISATISGNLTVTNATPVVGLARDPNPLIEGTAITYTGSFTDAGKAKDDAYVYTWTATSTNGDSFTQTGTVNYGSGATSVPTFTFTPTNDGQYFVVLKVQDEFDAKSSTFSADSEAGTDYSLFDVANVAPSVTIDSGPSGSNEGAGVTYTGGFSDPAGANDASYVYTWTAVGSNGDSFSKTGVLNYSGSPTSVPAFNFTPTNDGTYTVTLTVQDEGDGAGTTFNSDSLTGTATRSLTVSNTAPVVTITSEPAGKAGTEGAAVSYKGTFDDAGKSKDDFYAYTWTAVGSNGDSFTKTGVANYGGSATSVPDFVFTPTDEGTYTVTLTVQDEADASGTVFGGDSLTGGAATALAIANVAPTIQLVASPAGVVEGGTATFTVRGNDVGLTDVLNYQYQWYYLGTDGKAAPVLAATANDSGLAQGTAKSQSFVPPDDGVFRLRLTVSDADGGSTTSDFDFTVGNVAPTTDAGGTTVPAPGTVLEGQNFTIDYAFVDPGFSSGATGTNETFTISVDWGDGSGPQTYTPTVTNGSAGTATTGAAKLTHVYANNLPGGYQVKVTVTDDDGGSTTTNYVASIANIAPTVAITAGPSTTTEGALAIYSGTFDDPAGSQDDDYFYTWTAVGSNGDSFTQSGVVKYAGAPTSVPALSIVPTNDGTYTITLTVSDEYSGGLPTADTASGTATRNLTVSNVAPTVTIDPPPFGTSVGEGTSVTYKASFTDPGLGKDDTYVYTWTAVGSNGDSFTKTGTISYGGGATNVPAFTFTPTDDGVYTVTVTVQDEADGAGAVFNPDSLKGSASVGLTSTNVLPAPNIAAGPTLSPEGTPVTFKGGFFDPGLNKDATYTVTWTAVGDNGQTETFATTASGVGPVADFVFTPDDDGTYTITLTIVDDDGGSKTVTAAPLVVTDVPPSTTIFDPNGGTAGFTGLEGGSYVFSGFFSDKSTKEKYDVRWEALDSKGNVIGAQLTKDVKLGATPSFGFNPADNDSYTIRLTVLDSKGHQTVDDYTFSVANVNPTVTVTSPAGSIGNEGTAVTFDGAFTDPAGKFDADYAYEWTVVADNGQIVPNVSGSNPAVGAVGKSLTFTPVNDGVYTIRLTVTDDDGGRSFDEFTYTVNNVAPTVSVTNPADGAHSDEGTALTYLGTFTDPGAAADDTYVYTWTAVGDDGQTYTQTGNVAYVGAVTIVPAFTFTPTDDTHFTVTLKVQDDPAAAQSLTGTDAVDLYVDNVAPAPTQPSGPTAANEGDTVVYNASFVDPGGAADATYDVVWTATGSNGQTATFTTTASSPGAVAPFSFSLDDDGTYTITVTITDKDGAFTTSKSSTLVVADVLPTVVVLDPNGGTSGYAGFEGSAYTFTGSFADPSAPGRESYTATWTVFKGSAVVPMTTQVQGGVALAGAVNSLTFTPPDDDVYRIVLTIVDDSGHSNSQEYQFQAANVVPDPEVTGPSNGLEGQSVSFGGSFFDPAGAFDAFYNYVWSVTSTNGQTVAGASGFASGNGPVGGFSFTPFDDGVYTITLSVTDKDGAVGVQTFTFTAANDDPTAVVAAEPAPATLVEGNLLSFSLQGTDPGSNDVLSYDYEFYFLGKSGTDAPILLAAGGAAGKATGDLLAASFTPPDDGVYELRFRVTDDDGGSDEIVRSYTVVNAAPSSSIFTSVPAAGSVTEGQLFQIHYNFTDPGFSSGVTKTNESFTILVDWGDGTAAEAYTPTVTNGSAGGLTIGAVEFKHRYADDVVGGYKVTVSVTDDDGGVLTEVFNAGIANSTPTITASAGTQYVNEGSVLGFSGDFSSGNPLLRFEDLGFTEGKTSEDFFVDIDWGDGAKELNVPVTTVLQGSRIDGVTVSKSVGYVPASHVYDDNNPLNAPYTVTVTLRDDDGGVATFTFSVVVQNVTPDVSVTGPTDGDEGSSVTFLGGFNDPGGPFDGDYDYQWTVTSNNGQTVPGKSGSTPLPPGGSSLTFTPFDNGTYTITLSVTDKDGAVGSKSFTFTAHNVDPTASIYLTPNPADLVEGKTITYGLVGTDVGSNDVLTYDYKLYYLGTNGKGAPVLLEHGTQANVSAAGVNFGYNFAAPDNGKYSIVFTVTDDDGGSKTDTVDFDIANVAPTIDSVVPIFPGAFDQIDEGYGVYFSFSFSDPGYQSSVLGTDETFKAFIDWGDGTFDVYTLPSFDPNGYGVVSPGGPGTPTTGEVFLWHVFADNGLYDVRIHVLDDDGGLGAASPIPMEVHNVAPFFYGVDQGGLTFVQGDVVTLFIPFYDPGFKTETFTVSINYGGLQSLLLSSPSLFRDPADPNQQAYVQAVVDTQQFFLFGQFSMTVTVTDDDGGSATIVIPVQIIENPNFRFDLPKIETTSLTVPPPAPAVAPQTTQASSQGVQASNESRSGSRSSPPPKKVDLLNNIRLLLRVDRLRSFRGAVEKVELNDVLQSSDLLAYRDKLSRLGHGVFRITLSSEGAEAQSQEIELTQDNSSKAWRLLDSLMKRLESQFDPEQELQNLIPIPGTTHMDSPSGGRRIGVDGIRVGDLERGPGPVAPGSPLTPTDERREADRGTGRKVSSLGPSEMFDGAAALDDPGLFEGAALQSGALAALAATWAGRRSLAVRPRRGKALARGEGAAVEDGDLDVFFDWLGRGGGGAGGRT